MEVSPNLNLREAAALLQLFWRRENWKTWIQRSCKMAIFGFTQ